MMFGGLLATSATPAVAQTFTAQPFTAYGQGDAIALNALALGTTTLAGARIAASGGSVNSAAGGLTAVTNEFGQNVGPARADKNAYGRGTAIEAGVLTANPQTVDLNQLILTGLAEAFAPPPSPLVTKDITIPVNNVLYASTARGEAKATFDPMYCPVGRPLSFGRGFVENLQLLGAGNNPDGSITTPALGTSISAGNPRATTQSRTVTYLISNGDGTFGVASETRQTVAPITVGLAGVATLTIEVAGEYGLKTVATGKPGGATVTTIGTPVVTITGTILGAPVNIAPITVSNLLGPNGLNASIAGVLTALVGTPPRALNGAAATTPTLAADGTSASGAVDLARIAVPALGVDLGLAHMEGRVTVPAGGIKCTIPVSKTASVDPVTVGTDFTYTIKIPSDSALFNSLFNCDLVNISATDTASVESGTPKITFVSADKGGVVSGGNKVTWANLGNYTLGQDPIVLTINARIPSNSGAGVLRDTVDVSAALGNCRGGTTGEDIVGQAQVPGSAATLNGSAITGAVTLVGPNVTRGDLAATGGNSWPLVAGGGFLLAALGLVRLRRRVTEVPAKG